MLKASDITTAIVTAMRDHVSFEGWEVTRSEYVNVDPNNCPWAGIYRQSLDYNPETLGLGPDHWEATIVIRALIQASNFASGEQCEDDLEALVEKFLDFVIDDTTLSGTIDMVNSIRVTYSYVAEEEDTIYFQAAIVELNLEVSTS